MRVHPVTGVYKLHTGTDLGVPCGTDVHASLAGTVIEAGWNDAYGWRTVITHGAVDGVLLTTTYNHQTHLDVTVGDKVAAGQVIGISGTTGFSTGCHLHFELASTRRWSTRSPGCPRTRSCRESLGEPAQPGEVTREAAGRPASVPRAGHDGFTSGAHDPAMTQGRRQGYVFVAVDVRETADVEVGVGPGTGVGAVDVPVPVRGEEDLADLIWRFGEERESRRIARGHRQQSSAWDDDPN